MSHTKKNVKVVVLGDIGRSPRMQYHCLSLSEEGHQVDVIGYGDTDPLDALKLNPSIFYHYLMPIPQIPIRLINYVFKTLLQALNLMFLLFITTRSDVVIVQNPPAIPALVVCWIYTLAVKAKFVIDWHNYAHTVMALNVGQSSPLVKITRKVERVIGQKADHNFCVTKAMRTDLQEKWNIKSVTLYDRPPLRFKPVSLTEKHQFLLKFGDKYNKAFISQDNETIFTEVINEEVKLKASRPGLLISSTSWTEDEDFSVLLTALQEYELHCQQDNPRKLPKLICVITGKGPLKEFYLNKISHLSWKYVSIITPWLESEDYPLLLACADLGVCLHVSSSGLDLPMKVVDMFGCGLPVCAHAFHCLNELVINEENSFTFASPQELSKQILNWFESFPDNDDQKIMKAKFQARLKEYRSLRWRENWKSVAGPVFD